MNTNLLPIIAAVIMVLVMFVMMLIVLSRYTKVGPNQLLVVSGRKRHLPDGSVVGFRFVKGGGTFVFPVIEKVDVLSLEVLTIELPRTLGRAAGGAGVAVDCTAQVKISSDDASLARAVEVFLGKEPDEIKATVCPLVEKHLVGILGSMSLPSIIENPVATAAAVQASASADLAKLGLGMISVTLRNAQAA